MLILILWGNWKNNNVKHVNMQYNDNLLRYYYLEVPSSLLLETTQWGKFY